MPLLADISNCRHHGGQGLSFPPQAGCKLSEFERVTALKVYNWFANRRKEMKRRANIGEELYMSLTLVILWPQKNLQFPSLASTELLLIVSLTRSCHLGKPRN